MGLSAKKKARTAEVSALKDDISSIQFYYPYHSSIPLFSRTVADQEIPIRGRDYPLFPFLPLLNLFSVHSA